MRRHVMISKPEHEMDLTEIWIRRFADQNQAYNVVWSDRYTEIENAMAALQTRTALGHRGEVVSQFQAWLEAEADRDREDCIPFREEAALFSPFYWTNKRKYAEAMSSS